MESSVNPDWRTFLELKTALACGEKRKVEELLEQPDIKVDINSTEDKVGRPLHLAVTLGCPKIVQSLIDKGAYVNCQNYNNETPLIMAAKMARNEVADVLLSVKDQRNYSNKEGLSHLHIACMRNSVKVVRQLLLKGADINQAVKMTSIGWKGFTPLHFAVQFNCFETVRFLVCCGADITVQDERQLTPLHLAFAYHKDKIVDLMLSYHKYEIQNPMDSDGLSHFHIACTRNNPEIVQSFITHGADVNMKVSEDSMYHKNCRPIHLAIQHECLDVVKLLLAYTVNLKVVDGIDPMQLAFATINEKLVSVLQSRIVIPRIDKVFKNLSDPTVLVEIVNEILNSTESESNINITEAHWSYWTGYTPLHLAVKNKNVQVIEILLKQKCCYITKKDATGKTPLHLAFESNQMNIIDLILSAHIQINENAVDSNGLSHFHISCMRNNLKVVEHFIKNKTDINSSVELRSPFWPGYTPLQFACKFKQKHLVRFLLDTSADISIKNGLGLTAFDIAILNFNEKNEYDKINEISIIESMLLKLTECKIDSFDDKGFSLLHIYCISKDLDFITKYFNTESQAQQEQVNKCINWSETVYHGCTPLLFALKFYHGKSCLTNNLEVEKLVEYLLLINSDINVRDSTLNTALHYAKSSEKLTKLLILHEADVNAQNIQGNTPLHYDWISDEVNLKVMCYLLNTGADINIENEFNETPFTSIVLVNDDKQNLCLLIMMKHVKKLNVIGHPISQNNKAHYKRWLQDFERQKVYKDIDFEEECVKEIENLKKYRVANYSTLYDLMFEDQNHLAAHSRNESLKRMLECSSFNTEYPNYGSVIKVQFRKGLKRRLLLESSIEALNFLSEHFNLIDDCLENILKYLSNNDLQMIGNPKEFKLNFDHIL